MQVERVREIEVGQARLAEASRWRKEIRKERAELERLYGERVKRVREQEEALMSRVREQQRDVERSGYEHRQRLIAEDERLRSSQAVRPCATHHAASVRRRVAVLQRAARSPFAGQRR